MKNDIGRLEKIIDCLEQIQAYSKHGESYFLTNRMCQDAILRNFQVIGDAIKELSPEFTRQHSDIDWSAWARFRDKLTHDYFGVNLDLVWEAVEERAPTLKRQLVLLR